MKTISLDDLISTVEAVRQELHPDLDPHFLETVVRAVQAHLDDPVEARRTLEAAVKQHLTSVHG